MILFEFILSWYKGGMHSGEHVYLFPLSFSVCVYVYVSIHDCSHTHTLIKVSQLNLDPSNSASLANELAQGPRASAF